jgi:hypothetical protein
MTPRIGVVAALVLVLRCRDESSFQRCFQQLLRLAVVAPPTKLTQAIKQLVTPKRV